MRVEETLGFCLVAGQAQRFRRRTGVGETGRLDEADHLMFAMGYARQGFALIEENTLMRRMRSEQRRQIRVGHLLVRDRVARHTQRVGHLVVGLTRRFSLLFRPARIDVVKEQDRQILCGAGERHADALPRLTQ